MKTLVIAALALGAIGLAAGTVFADPSGGGATTTTAPAHGGHCVHGFWHRMGKQLNLTDDQKAQIKDIMHKAHEQAKGLTDRAAKHKVWADAREQAKKVLTPEQAQKLADLLKACREKCPNRHGKCTSQPAGAAT